MSSSQQEPSWTGIDFANVVEDMSPSPLKRRRSLDPHTLEQVYVHLQSASQHPQHPNVLCESKHVWSRDAHLDLLYPPWVA